MIPQKGFDAKQKADVPCDNLSPALMDAARVAAGFAEIIRWCPREASIMNRPFDTGNSPLYWCAKHKAWHTPGLPYTCQEEETTVSACKYRRPCNCCPCGHCDCFFGDAAKCCACEEMREPLIVFAIPEK